MIDRVLEFGRALRDAGVPVAVSSAAEALVAITHVDPLDERAFRSALAATLIKTESHRPAFDTLFDLYFRAGSRPGGDPDEGDRSDAAGLQQEVARAIAGGDGASLPGLAEQAVASFGRVPSDRGGNQWFSNYEVTRHLDLDGLLARLLTEAGDEEPSWSASLRGDELKRNMETFRNEILRATRRRSVEQKGPAAVASYAVRPPRDEAPFLSAVADPAELRRAVRPLSRKLATRLAAKRRRARRAQLDMRRTVRRSLASGGVPLDPAFRKRVPHRPELVVLCDISSSVARFSQFALMLAHALSSQFSKVRSFVFVDDLVEVSRWLAEGDLTRSMQKLTAQATLLTRDSRSDYGEVLRRFSAQFPDAVGPKSTLLILGDARNNYRARNETALAELKRRAHRVYWLNPEPRSDWDTGDSVAAAYAQHTALMVEVRNLRQLQSFIAREL